MINPPFSLSKKELEIQKKRHHEMMLKLRKIKLAIFDVDGVLTDGKIYCGEQGKEVIKVFNVKDGSAFNALQQRKIKLAIISGRDSEPLRARMKELKVKYCYFGSKNKLTDYESLIKKLRLKDEQVLYVGDDLIDIELMDRVGISLAPADAHLLAQRSADAILSVDGGGGVAQLVSDMFMMADSFSEKEIADEFDKKTYKDPFKLNIH